MTNKEFNPDFKLDFNPDVDLVIQAIAGMCPVSATPAFLQGMTGGSALRQGIPLLASDLTQWRVPGLKWCGIQADLVTLPELSAEGIALLQQQLRRSQGVPVFAFSAPIDRNTPPDAETFTENPDGVLILDPVITRQGLVTGPARSRLTVRDTEGASRTLSYVELKADFSHLLLLRKSTRRGVRAVHRAVALRTWAVFARAYPERFLSPGSQAAAVAARALAADFWRQLAGSDRSAVAHSLRRLADSLENARTPDAVQAVSAALSGLTAREFLLSAFVEEALLAPTHSVLTDSERHDLIYLARAGTRDLKVFAAYRLRFERERADARSTLQQMRFDADPWVRAAARL